MCYVITSRRISIFLFLSPLPASFCGSELLWHDRTYARGLSVQQITGLKFKRQELCSTKQRQHISNLVSKFSKHHVYIHPQCAYTLATKNCFAYNKNWFIAKFSSKINLLMFWKLLFKAVFPVYITFCPVKTLLIID